MVDLKFCEASASIWQYAGYVLFALKIVVPLIIIILGIVDFTKAVTSNKDDMTTNALKSLIIRVVIGVAIFFIPLIIRVFFSLISDASEFIKNGEACRTCLLSPFSDACSNYKAIAQKYYDDRKNNAMTGGGTLVTDAACYYCNHEYIWTNTPDEKNCYGPIGPDLSGQEMSQAVCENKNNDDNNKQETNTAPNEKDKDKDDEGYTPGGTTPTPTPEPDDSDDDNSDDDTSKDSDNTMIIYVGDTRTKAFCDDNKVLASRCIYASGKGYDWLIGQASFAANEDYNSKTPISTIKTMITQNSNKKLIIVVNLGLYDMGDNLQDLQTDKTENKENALKNAQTAAINMATNYATQYINLSRNEWKNAYIIVTSIAKINNYAYFRGYSGSNYNSIINSFNSKLQNLLPKLNNLKYCNVTAHNFDYATGGIIFDKDSNQTLYSRINSMCISKIDTSADSDTSSGSSGTKPGIKPGGSTSVPQVQ